jgi:hypothetical protein
MAGLLSTKDLPDGHPAWSLLTGRTPFLACQVDQRFSYGAYIPSGYRAAASPLPLLVAQHGTARWVEKTRDHFVGFAERHGVAVLVPFFPGGIDDPNDLHNYKLIGYHGIRFDELLLAMVDEARERWWLDADRFLLAGFSGGGQFAHRFFYLHADRLRGVSIGAPGRVTLPDGEPWPYGLGDVGDRFGLAPDWDTLKRVPCQVVVGGADEAGEVLAAVAQDDREHRAGATRVERAQSLAGALESRDVDVRYDVVPGVGHDWGACLPVIEDFLAAALA